VKRMLLEFDLVQSECCFPYLALIIRLLPVLHIPAHSFSQRSRFVLPYGEW